MTHFIHNQRIWDIRSQHWMYVSRQFKSLHLPPVKGGRWKIRKLRDGQWFAWSAHGNLSSRWRRKFNTWEDARDWACFVIYCYDLYKFPGDADQVIRAAKAGQNIRNTA